MDPKLPGQINDLPTEMIISLCRYLEPAGLYSLSLTARRFYGPATEQLLRRAVGANVTKNGTQVTVLQWAALHGRHEVAQKLLDLGADFHVRLSDGRSLLHLVANRGSHALASQLIALGICPTVADCDGNTAIVSASRGGHDDVLDLLLDSAIFPASQLAKGLCVAATLGFSSTVRLLCERKADTSTWDAFDLGPAIWCAAVQGNVSTIETLLHAGADPCSRGLDSSTPLHKASENGHSAVVRRLLTMGGVSPDERDAQGRSALTVAVTYQNHNVMRVLISHGADLTLADEDQKTPLSIAIRNNDLEGIRILQQAGARTTCEAHTAKAHGQSPPSFSVQESVVGPRTWDQNSTIMRCTML